jgi:hypothetical protein
MRQRLFVHVVRRRERRARSPARHPEEIGHGLAACTWNRQDDFPSNAIGKIRKIRKLIDHHVRAQHSHDRTRSFIQRHAAAYDRRVAAEA